MLPTNRTAMFKKNINGITLIEILVAMGIFVVAITLVFVFVSQGFRTSNFSLEQSTAIAEAQRGIETMVRELRETQAADTGAYPLEFIDKNELIFYGDIDRDNKTERVRYFLAGSDFRKGIIEPSGDPTSYLFTDERINTISQYVRNTSTTPIFSYYNGDWPADTINNPLSTPADPTEPKLVKVYLKINVFPERAPVDFDLESSVHLRNLKDNL